MKKVYFISSYSNYPKGVVGESNYQDNIKNVLVYTGDEKKRIREDGFSAELFLEDENPHDPNNAVRVEIDGEIVGYLSTSDASWYRKSLEKLGLKDVIGVCGASIVGKREYEFEDHNFGVFLDLDLKNLQVEPERISKEVQVEKPPLDEINQNQKTPTQPKTQAKKPKNKRKPIFIAIALIIVLPLTIACFVFLYKLLEVIIRL